MARYMNGCRPRDPEMFFTYLLERAQHLRPFTGTAREAAQNAVLMAHNTVHREVFLSCLDALGGLQAVLQRLTEAMLEPEKE